MLSTHYWTVPHTGTPTLLREYPHRLTLFFGSPYVYSLHFSLNVLYYAYVYTYITNVFCHFYDLPSAYLERSFQLFRPKLPSPKPSISVSSINDSGNNNSSKHSSSNNNNGGKVGNIDVPPRLAHLHPAHLAHHERHESSDSDLTTDGTNSYSRTAPDSMSPALLSMQKRTQAQAQGADQWGLLEGEGPSAAAQDGAQDGSGGGRSVNFNPLSSSMESGSSLASLPASLASPSRRPAQLMSPFDEQLLKAKTFSSLISVR